jgi:hypothetical protein
VVLETLKESLEHVVQLRGWVVPPDDGIAEPHQALNTQKRESSEYDKVDD